MQIKVTLQRYIYVLIQEFEWKSALGGGSGRRDSRCEIETNTPPDDSNAALETYGNRSRCFGHWGKWTQRKCGRMRTFAQYGAGCYEVCLRDFYFFMLAYHL